MKQAARSLRAQIFDARRVDRETREGGRAARKYGARDTGELRLDTPLDGTDIFNG